MLIQFSLQLKQTYRNSWTLDARAGRWNLDAGLWTLDSECWTLDAGHQTLDAGLWMLDSGCWTLDAGLWTLDSGRWTLRLGSQALGTKHSCRLVQRVQVLTLNVKCYVIKEYQINFYCEKLNYITSSYLGLFRSSRPEPSIFKNLSRKYRLQSRSFGQITD